MKGWYFGVALYCSLMAVAAAVKGMPFGVFIAASAGAAAFLCVAVNRK